MKIYVHRIGRHHFAHLRAIAQGVDVLVSAHQYLGIDHGHEAVTAHRQTMDKVRAVARRHHERAWRLVGLAIKLAQEGVTEEAGRPSLEDFIAERDLDGWSEADVSEMYLEAYPVDAKAGRRARLRERQMDLLKRLELLAAEIPSPADPVAGWFDDATAQRLASAGIVDLGELNRRISTGGTWYRSLPSVGVAKAQRVASHLAALLPLEPPPKRPHFVLGDTAAQPSESNALPVNLEGSSLTEYSGGEGGVLKALNDGVAVDAWVCARAGQIVTARAYRKEAQRLQLWLQYERGGKVFAQMTVTDCGDYIAFLQNIPDRWISRQRAAPGTEGWAPWRGQMAHGPQQQSITIVSGMFNWLLAAQYIKSNPWVLINKKTGDDAKKNLLDTKAFSEEAMAQVVAAIEAKKPSLSRDRIVFIIRFLECVGLRSAELLAAKLGDIRHQDGGFKMSVFGKGAKNRVVVIPSQAMKALEAYLVQREFTGLQDAPEDAPLIASLHDSLEPIGYQALYETVRSWLKKGVAGSGLPTREQLKLRGASTHWLRHTFGTRAIERGVPADVIQAQMGHASIQTTTGIYGRAPIKRRTDELNKAFE